MFKYFILIILIQTLKTSFGFQMKEYVNLFKNFTTEKHIDFKKKLHQLENSGIFYLLSQLFKF